MTKIQTLFHEKDIRFLIHEPIVWKFRDFKVRQMMIKSTDCHINHVCRSL